MRRLRRLLRRALKALVPDVDLELSVVLVDEPRIKELNREHMDRDEVTDVLAFPLMKDEELGKWKPRVDGWPEPVGDIAICVPVAMRQAEERGWTEAEEMDLLAVHGLLHLVGYEDETGSGAKRMEAMEKELLGRNIDGLD